jgi:hypothetical protein
MLRYDTKILAEMQDNFYEFNKHYVAIKAATRMALAHAGLHGQLYCTHWLCVFEHRLWIYRREKQVITDLTWVLSLVGKSLCCSLRFARY